AATIQAALTALPTVGTNASGNPNVIVTAPTATTFAVTFINNLAGNTLPLTLTPSVSAFIGNSPTGATESGNPVTITSTLAHNFTVGQTVTISGVGVTQYNGTFTIASVPTANTFTYFNPTSGLAGSGGGTATVNNLLGGTLVLNNTSQVASKVVF